VGFWFWFLVFRCGPIFYSHSNLATGEQEDRREQEQGSSQPPEHHAAPRVRSVLPPMADHHTIGHIMTARL